MDFIAMVEIRELQRLQSPATYPQSIAVDGSTLWIGSCQSQKIYAVDIAAWTVQFEAQAPGEPFGITVVDTELRVILGFGDDADDRYIYRFTVNRGFGDEGIACPELSGAYLAYDGAHLMLSQAWNKKLLTLTSDGKVLREIPLLRRPVGMTFAHGVLYLVTTDDDWQQRELASMNLNESDPQLKSLAAVPFSARGLGFDGASFWTTDREKSEVVKFTYEA